VNVAKVMKGVPDALDAPTLSESLKNLIYTMMILVCVYSLVVLLTVCSYVSFVRYIYRLSLNVDLFLSPL
jgi:hypothetical protein